MNNAGDKTFLQWVEVSAGLGTQNAGGEAKSLCFSKRLYISSHTTEAHGNNYNNLLNTYFVLNL